MGGFFIMAKILVFNNDTDRMETYYRGEAEPMPYIMDDEKNDAKLE